MSSELLLSALFRAASAKATIQFNRPQGLYGIAVDKDPMAIKWQKRQRQFQKIKKVLRKRHPNLIREVSYDFDDL